MGINWKDAPEWANFVAMDDDGLWWWYENRPVQGDNEWKKAGGFFLLAEDKSPSGWEASLTGRPQEQLTEAVHSPESPPVARPADP